MSTKGTIHRYVLRETIHYPIFPKYHLKTGAGIIQWYNDGLRTERWRGGFESQQRLGIFLFTSTSGPAL
jgi:hypothetical protein